MRKLSRTLLLTRGRVIGDAPLTDEYINQTRLTATLLSLHRHLQAGETKLREIPGLKPVLRLHPPRKGYKTTKRTFHREERLDIIGQEINTLLYKMR